MKLLTTGQAANLCSVTPDTVLKWIHSGCLRARRTAGGHHRIAESDLTPFVEPANRPEIPEPQTSDLESILTRYCWEHNSEGTLANGCKDCVVYQLRAQRCYEVAKITPEIGHTKLFCEGDCANCDYYRLVHLQAINVMVVTDDQQMIGSLEREKEMAPYNLEITECEYSASAKMDSFRPDYVVVDCSFGAERSEDICHHLIEDPRLPHVRVVLAVDEGGFPKECDKSVFARIQRPFRVSDITQCIHGTQN